VLLFPGAPRPYKGIDDLLAALDTLNQPDLRLVIVGGSPYDDYDQVLAKRWGKWLIQLPKCPYEMMPEVVAAAHVIVVPQQDHDAAKAQFPLKLTDGMAMAKPILATTVGDIPEILGNTGYLVAPDSPPQLANMLQTILNNPEQAASRGHLARERCIQRYSVDAMAETLGPLIQQCVNRQSLNQLGYRQKYKHMESRR
jgi:glycosyltransferase involved in cell wall biosynthesis